jgi:GGDEF domain-containing protein
MGVPGRKFLVTAVIDRLQAINARHGSDVGDAVLKELGSHMRKNLQPNDRLFRWNGPAITGLIQREKNITEVRASLNRMFESGIEKEFSIDGEQVVIPLKPAWSVVGLIPPATNIFNYVDRFIASQKPQGLEQNET